jgi:hypothetical protein
MLTPNTVAPASSQTPEYRARPLAVHQFAMGCAPQTTVQIDPTMFRVDVSMATKLPPGCASMRARRLSSAAAAPSPQARTSNKWQLLTSASRATRSSMAPGNVVCMRQLQSDNASLCFRPTDDPRGEGIRRVNQRNRHVVLAKHHRDFGAAHHDGFCITPHQCGVMQKPVALCSLPAFTAAMPGVTQRSRSSAVGTTHSISRMSARAAARPW